MHVNQGMEAIIAVSTSYISCVYFFLCILLRSFYALSCEVFGPSYNQ